MKSSHHAKSRLTATGNIRGGGALGGGGGGGGGLAGVDVTLVAEPVAGDLLPIAVARLKRGAVDDVARRYWDAGVRHIVALRGDVPGGGAYQPHPDGYAHAGDLVQGLRRIADFEVTVAAYPETHPEAASAQADLENLKRKLDAGATRAITNYFFETETYLRFLDRCLAAGITAPIVPGIMPVSNIAQAVRFSALCGATVPAWLVHMFDGTEADPETRRMVGAIVAAEQVRLLRANGIDEFHFYTLNRPDLTFAIAHILGARPLAPTGTA